MHPFAERQTAARGAAIRTYTSKADDLTLRIALASLPLVWLVLGVLGLALWTAH